MIMEKNFDASINNESCFVIALVYGTDPELIVSTRLMPSFLKARSLGLCIIYFG